MSFYPNTVVNLTGNNQILQGTDWTRTFTAKDTGGTPIDLSGYDSVPPRCQMRVLIGDATPFFTPTCAWVNAAGGQFRMTIPNATSSGKPNAPASGTYQVEIVKNSDSTVERIQTGEWAMDPEWVR